MPMRPVLPKIGKCLGCGRLLISDIYSLCWRCATALVEQPLPSRAHADVHPEGFVEQLYRETGGEG